MQLNSICVSSSISLFVQTPHSLSSRGRIGLQCLPDSIQMITYIKHYKTLSCPSVSKNVYVGAHTEILLKFAIKIKFF